MSLLWQVVVNEFLIGLIAALGCLVGGTLLLPTLATDELRGVLADIIQTCGMSISGYASRIFPPEEVTLAALASCCACGQQAAGTDQQQVVCPFWLMPTNPFLLGRRCGCCC